MSASEAERTITIQRQPVVGFLSSICVAHPLDTYEQYLDACQAVYDVDYEALDKDEPLTRPRTPRQEDFENSNRQNVTEFPLYRKSEQELVASAERLVEVLRESHQLDIVLVTANPSAL